VREMLAEERKEIKEMLAEERKEIMKIINNLVKN